MFWLLIYLHSHVVAGVTTALARLGRHEYGLQRGSCGYDLKCLMAYGMFLFFLQVDAPTAYVKAAACNLRGSGADIVDCEVNRLRGMLAARRPKKP